MRYVLFALLFVVTGVLVLIALPSRQRVKPEDHQTNLPVETLKENIRDVTPENALPGPDVPDHQLNRLPNKQVLKKKITKAPKTIYSNLIVPSAGILSSKDTMLIIRDIIPLELDEICATASAEKWPCGRFARTAMRQLVLRNSIECEPVESGEKSVSVKCQIAGRDIGQWLVSQGWAKSQGEIYAFEMAKAKENHQGMWRQSLP